MKVRFFDPTKDYLRFRKEYDAAWESVNLRGDLILRKDTEKFEEKLANYVGTKYAVAVSNGTDALMLAYKAVGVGREHWSPNIPSHTFKATVGAAILAHPDVLPKIYDLGEIPVDSDIGVVAHIGGELYPLFKTNYAMIEDAAQALGAVKNPTSDVQTWSFYPAKLLGCKGEAGGITTNSYSIYEYIKEFRNHFKTDNRAFGGNYRMDNLQAAILNVKFKYIDEILSRRDEIAQNYLVNLKGIGLPNIVAGRVWQDFIVRTPERDKLYDYLKENEIETMKNEYPFSPEYPKLPLAAKYESETLRLPCNENLTNEEINYVIEKINDFFS